MASYEEILNSLPNEVRPAYMKSHQKMTPKMLALRFGVEELREEPRVPRTTASQQAERYAKQAMQGWQDIHMAHWSSVADQTADKRSAYLRSAQFAKKQLQRLESEHNDVLDAIEEKSKHLATVLGNARKPPSNVGDAMIDAEVRAMIRATTDVAKANAIAAAHPRAVASAPPVASGMGEDVHKRYVRQYLQQVEPEALADNDDLSEALTQITAAHTELTKETRALIDFEAADRMEKLSTWIPPQRDAA